jgi:hypothetical protein
MIRIDNLNEKQVKFLDKLWSMDTQEEVSAWFRTLSDEDLNMALTLHEMLIGQMLEQPAEDDVSMAQSMLRDIGVKF